MGLMKNTPFKSMDWLPIKCKNVGGNSKRCRAKRVFGKNGKLFPRMIISIWEDVLGYEGNFKIVGSRKENSKAWWTDCGIPNELLPVVKEMIDEVLN